MPIMPAHGHVVVPQLGEGGRALIKQLLRAFVDRRGHSGITQDVKVKAYIATPSDVVSASVRGDRCHDC